MSGNEGLRTVTGTDRERCLRVEKAVYGGDGLVRTVEGRVMLLPFVLPGELVQLRDGPAPDQRPGDQPVQGEVKEAAAEVRVVEASPERTQPPCVHFGVCGGCQYQMATYPAQLRLKKAILEESLRRGSTAALPETQVWGSPEPWGYRNRIRLRVRTLDGQVRLGYHRRGTEAFLPITMCPIAAPLLVQAVRELERAAAEDAGASLWLQAAAEVELLCDAGEGSLSVHLLCPGAPKARKGSFGRLAEQVKQTGLPLVTMEASRLHRSSGRPLETIEAWGAGGLRYTVGQERFWLEPGSFFQVNRLLLPQMVELVCGRRSGTLAWDLFAGAGLFARQLAMSFDVVTAVEANPVAVAELRRGLRRRDDTAVAQTTLDFLRVAVLQRERPALVVLDPPRAGAGEESCALLLRLRPQTVVYVSCDPTTLGRDLSVLQAGYRVAELHMLDLFPQTYHLETVMVLESMGVAG